MTKKMKNKVGALQRGSLDGIASMGAVVAASSRLYSGTWVAKHKAVYKGGDIAGDLRKIGEDMHKSMGMTRNGGKAA